MRFFFSNFFDQSNAVIGRYKLNLATFWYYQYYICITQNISAKLPYMLMIYKLSKKDKLWSLSRLIIQKVKNKVSYFKVHSYLWKYFFKNNNNVFFYVYNENTLDWDLNLNKCEHICVHNLFHWPFIYIYVNF